jgi:uncharacterized membrane protein YphA (DoxX/SURF4 family)
VLVLARLYHFKQQVMFTQQVRGITMNEVLWIVQILLALGFLMAGFMKATQPLDKLSKMMGWINDFPPTIVRVIGVLEILAGIGLIVPMLTNIVPILTPLAAVGLVLTMIGAMITHVRRGEYSRLGVNVVFLLMAAFVAYGRFVALPVTM